MTIFSLIKSNWFFILFFSVFLAVLATYYQYTQPSLPVKNTILLTVAYVDEGHPEESEVAATYFGETIMGWFKNNAFIKEMSNNTDSSFSVFKQERQNMIIEIRASSVEDVNSLTTHVWEVLNQKIDNYNNLTQSKYLIIKQGEDVSLKKFNIYIWFIAMFFLALFIAVSLVSIKDIWYQLK